MNPALPRPTRESPAAGGRRLLALVLVWLAAGACGREPAPESGSAAAGSALPLWRIALPQAGEAQGQGHGPAVYVLASVAVPRSRPLRFDPVVLDAFHRSSRLVLANSAALSKQNALIGWKAHLAEGDALRRWIGPELHDAYTVAIGRAGFPPGTAEVTAPWFAARIVRQADLAREEFAGERELEVYFSQLAARPEPAGPDGALRAKAIAPLEESATSYDRFAALSPELQTGLLERAIARSQVAHESLPAAAEAWRTGDAERLAEQLEIGWAGHAAARQATEGAESARLADAVTALLDELASQGPEAAPAFLVAEARYVVGSGGLLARLAQHGLDVVQLRPSPGERRTARATPRLEPPPPPAPGERPRVLIVGVDGATLRVIRPLQAEGRLPVFARLAREGASGPLRSHRPLYSPRIWNSIATGKRPGKHGIEGFTFRDDAGRQQLYLSLHRKTHALWNIASARGLSVAVVNWWNTYPPEVIRGVMVSDHAKPTRLAELTKLTGVDAEPETGATVYPEAWRERAVRIFTARSPIAQIEDPFLGNVGIPDWMQKEELSKRFLDDAAACRIGLELDLELHPDLLMVFLPGIDRVSHRLWAAIEPPESYGDDLPQALRLSAGEREAAGGALRRYYEYTDELLGLLLRGFGERDLVLVLSDHGFEAGRHLGDLTGVHESEKAQDGILFARGPGIAPGSDTAGTTVDDVTPTVLAWLGLPLGRDMDGRPAPFLAESRRRHETIATWDTEPIERLGSGPSGSEDEILEQLRALGYIE